MHAKFKSLLPSGEVGAKREDTGIFSSAHIPLEKQVFLGIWSLVVVQFSCPEVNPKFAFEMASMSTLFTFTLDVRNSFQPRLHGQGGSAVDPPVLWKLQIKVIIDTYFNCSQVF